MSLALGCVADDYTGASDLANTLTKAGLRTIQTIGVPEEGRALPEADAVVVALKSRSIPADQAVARSREAEAWLRARGAAHVMFKVCSTFDSTDAGNIGPVMDALRAEAGAAIALVTPAFPETGRSVYQGNLFVGSVPLNESPLKDHPLNPMRDANLVRVLGRQSASPVGLIDTATVARGAEAVAARLQDLAAEGKGAAIADAIFDSDLETLGRAIIAEKFSVGASGLGLGLARALVADGRGTQDAAGAAVGEPVGGAAACLAGSCSQATLQQVAAAEKIMPVMRLDPARLLAGADVVAEALAFAAERLAAGPVLIASSAPPRRCAPSRPNTGSTRPATPSRRRWPPSPRASSPAACAGSWSPAAKPRGRWSTGWASPPSCSGRRSPRAYRCCGPQGDRSRCCSPSNPAISAARTSSAAPST